MLIATLINLEGKRAEVTVGKWNSRVPPSTLLRGKTVYSWDARHWQPGEICTATYHQMMPSRLLDITQDPIRSLTLTKQEEEEQAA